MSQKLKFDHNSNICTDIDLAVEVAVNIDDIVADMAEIDSVEDDIVVVEYNVAVDMDTAVDIDNAVETGFDYIPVAQALAHIDNHLEVFLVSSILHVGHGQEP